MTGRARLGGSLLGVFIVLTGVLISCSSEDGGDAADTPFGRTLTEKFLEEGGVNDEGEARCVAGCFVDSLGEDRLTELGFTPENIDMIEGVEFSEDAITQMVDVYFTCVDVRAVIRTNLASESGEDVAERVATRLPEQVLRDFVATGNFEVAMTEESDRVFRDIAAECGALIG